MFNFKRKKKEVVPAPKVTVPVSAAEVKQALDVFNLSESVIEVSTRAIKTQSQLAEVVRGLERDAATTLRAELKEHLLTSVGGSQKDLHARLVVAAQIMLGKTIFHPAFEPFRQRLAQPYLPEHLLERLFDLGKCTSHWNTIRPGAGGMLTISTMHEGYQKQSTGAEIDPASKQDEHEFWLAFAQKCLDNEFERIPQDESRARIWGGASEWILVQARVLEAKRRLEATPIDLTTHKSFMY